ARRLGREGRARRGGGHPRAEHPRVRRIARERAVDLDAVPGSGAHGRVTESDVARPAAKPLVLREGDVARPASPMRKVIARRLVESKQTVPHFYLEADLDVEALVALREQVNQAGTPETKVSVNDLLLRACALALRAVPEANASWIDNQIVQYDRVDVSVAVSIEEGLLTPVLRGADKLSLGALARATKELVAKARARKLTPEEMTGGTFSLSNLGMFQVDRFAAVINPPESMILAVGAVRDVPVVKAGAVVPGKRCAVTLSCDHRVVDGALGAKWLLALRGLVENPVRILL
ncbi:MAG: Dihydrolipoamide acetyltransferase component of pyruvate dehydrogenase complex, partial [Myxococcaceae bacterium]|nr:Dihydrolipoamide acetyltransferase component of pyruvate dehydrogenase complex [Myxococcaceae bacterium]